MTTVEISGDGQNNIGMQTIQTSLSDFQRTIRVPGRIVGQPEHWRMAVAAPVNSVVSEINVTAGESVDPGKLLCKLRVSDDELITRQTNLLEQVGQLEFVRRDEERLRSAVDAGGAAAKSLVERQHELRRLEISVAAAREGLGLVGLNNEQIETIINDRKLIGTMPVVAPGHHADEVCDDLPHTLTVSQINIVTGQRVTTGEALLTLGDYCKLQIEAYASESETPYIYRVLNENLAIAAILNPVGTSERNEKEQRLDGLKLLYIAPELDPQTRSLRLVINLDNEAVHESEVGGRKFTTWRYRPGERLEVLLPLEVWTKRIVLPADAVIQDGAESVVFVKENDTFIRHTVVEEYRDTNSVVLKEGALPIGEYVVTQGAFRVHLAMQNASGAKIDPHAGHSH
jgi:multidrug efflux pump subunit AcrA (membrane-fusion protein)